MSIAEICPCVNAGCPNHGQCDKCISRHVRLGNLNFCSFSTILPVLQRAIAADPESPAADVLREVVDDRLGIGNPPLLPDGHVSNRMPAERD